MAEVQGTRSAVINKDAIEAEWKELADRFYNEDTPLNERIRIVKKTGRASWESVSARKVLYDAVRGNVEGDRNSIERIEKAGKDALYESLHSYIQSEIRNHALPYVTTNDKRKNLENQQTMENEAFRWIMKGLDHYDPERGALSTYFAPHIRKGITLVASRDKRDAKRGQSENIRKVTVQINALHMENPGLKDFELLQALHAKLPDMSVERINESINIIKMSENRATLDDPDGLDAVSYIPGPEEEFVNAETKQNFYDAVRTLDEDELRVYCVANGLDMDMEEVLYPSRRPAEVARITGFSTDKVTFCSISARDKIKKYYQELDGKEYHDPRIIDEIEVPYLDDDTGDDEIDIMDVATGSSDGAAAAGKLGRDTEDDEQEIEVRAENFAKGIPA